MGGLDLPDRFWSKVEFEPNSGCWLWTGYTNHDGYGRVSIGGRLQMAHRATFGTVPEGAELDHKCRVRSCCNPDHLEAVSHRENVSRGHLSQSNAERHLKRTHCKHGHEYNPANTALTASGHRRCRVCHAEAERNRRSRAA